MLLNQFALFSHLLLVNIYSCKMLQKFILKAMRLVSQLETSYRFPSDNNTVFYLVGPEFKLQSPLQNSNKSDWTKLPAFFSKKLIKLNHLASSSYINGFDTIHTKANQKSFHFDKQLNFRMVVESCRPVAIFLQGCADLCQLVLLLPIQLHHRLQEHLYIKN